MKTIPYSKLSSYIALKLQQQLNAATAQSIQLLTEATTPVKLVCAKCSCGPTVALSEVAEVEGWTQVHTSAYVKENSWEVYWLIPCIDKYEKIATHVGICPKCSK